MPTGYTNSIKDGISFQTFVMQCARAMGACVSMRDDPSDKPIPDKFEASSWHKDRIKETKKELETLKKTSLAQAELKAMKQYKKENQEVEQAINKANDLRIKYKTMLIQVKDWQLPTPDHQGLKDFMIQQINSSIEFDCGTSYYTDKQVTLLTSQQWIEKETARLLKSLDYHIKKDMEERERVSGRNTWVKQLRESL